MNEVERPIQAYPSKNFFVDMLTKDIDLTDCILDLVDNSMHNLIHEKDMNVMGSLLSTRQKRKKVRASVRISLSPDRFRIDDDCGGFSSELAENEVFRMGFPKHKDTHRGLGLYGIGMKRAIFKIGRDIRVVSRTRKEHFEVSIDVESWRTDETNWTLPYSVSPKANRSKKTGTTIDITRLNKGVGNRFGVTAFSNELKRRIGTTYALFIKSGVTISVNGERVKHAMPSVATRSVKPVATDSVKPARRRFSTSNVDVLLIVGLSPKEDRRPHGWYVFCNGRMVLEADKDKKTGWGTNGTPQFHTKYNHFVGLAFFQSKDVQKLPWTTTKSDVEVDSPIYQTALAEMKIQTKPVTRFLNRFYPAEKYEEDVVERLALVGTRSTTVDQLPLRESNFVAPKKIQRAKDQANIAYKVSKRDLEKVKNRMRKPKLPNKEVGKRTFNYYLEKEC